MSCPMRHSRYLVTMKIRILFSGPVDPYRLTQVVEIMALSIWHLLIMRIIVWMPWNGFLNNLDSRYDILFDDS